MDEIDPESIDDGIIVEFVNGECVVTGQLDGETTVGSPADVLWFGTRFCWEGALLVMVL